MHQHVFWWEIPVKIKAKEQHVRKIGGRMYNSFIVTYGDVPMGRFNEITNEFEEVVNNRGKAYAARKRLMYRNKR